MPQAVLTVVPGVQFDMAEAVGLATVMNNGGESMTGDPQYLPEG